MRKNIIVCALATCFLPKVLAETVAPSDSWREDPTVVGVNKEVAHATYTPYATVADLMADKEFYATPWVESKSTLRRSLNGNWKFHYSPTPESAPSNFHEAGFDSSDWATLPVPSVWAMHGYDIPMYVNVDYPFDKSKCPKIVRRSDNNGYDTNPTGCYLTSFTIPAKWAGKEFFLNFEGIYSGAYVWVNGQFVGYTQGANTDHEFDITPYAKQGANTLAVKVIKWTDGSYLEDQDMFRWGGIFRDVTLTAVPRTFIRDHYISCLPTKGSKFANGTLKTELEISNRSAEAFTGTVKTTLYDTDGTTVFASLDDQPVSVQPGQTITLNASKALTGFKPWTCETPNLYTVVFSLLDANGNETEAFATKYGFRRIEVNKQWVNINGKKVFFKGVNRQDCDPVTGRMQTTELLLKDVLLFKQYNINTVRTSHCPHQSKMMAMYDHFGIYVMDEADLESHAMWGDLVNRSDWTGAYVDRQERMVRRDRNHPSVIFWSMGNESNCGSNFEACYNAIKELDDRLIHYEGQGDWSYTDLTSKMYPNESEVIGYDNRYDYKQRPNFFCEYAHSMGQSLGNFVDYWDYFENSTRTIGGCIWDWADQAIYSPAEVVAGTYKKGDFRTGYDYPGPHQGNFMSNGVVGPEREVTAKLIEVKKVHQWIKMTDFNADEKTLTVNNTYDFIDLSGFKIAWSLSANGKEVEAGTVNGFNVASEKSATLTIPFTTVLSPDAEYLLTVRFLTLEPTDWADAGHCVAEEQFAVTGRVPLAEVNVDALSPTLQVRGNGPVLVIGEGFTYRFDAEGNLVGLKVGEREYIHDGQGLKYDNFRWIENDAPLSGIPPQILEGDAAVNEALLCDFIEGDATGAKAVALTAHFEANGVKYTNVYTIYADGTMDLNTTYISNNKNLKRAGQRVSLSPALENIEYFARGPWSNYSDRKTGSFAAVYHSTVTDQHEHFVRPQNMGNHEELRYIKFTSPDDPDFGLLIEAEGQCSFSALHHIESDYAAKHDFQTLVRPEVILHLDYQQMGLGNGSCGSGVWDRYFIPTGRQLKNQLRFTPLAPKSPQEVDLEGLDYTTLESADSYTPADNTYGTPAGSMHGDGKAWLKEISTEGALSDIKATWTTKPLVYSRVKETVKVLPGSDFTLNMIGNEAGPRSTTVIYQDLRYNTASIFADWYQTTYMETLATFGNKFSGANTLANYDEVMNISQTIHVPSDAKLGKAIIRVIYNNAWKDWPTYDYTNIYEGCAYDIPVEITDGESSISDVQVTDGERTVYDLMGRRLTGRLIPGVYIINGKKTLVR